MHCNQATLAAHQGFEPRQTGSEPVVLPLHQRALVGGNQHPCRDFALTCFLHVSGLNAWSVCRRKELSLGHIAGLSGFEPETSRLTGGRSAVELEVNKCQPPLYALASFYATTGNMRLLRRLLLLDLQVLRTLQTVLPYTHPLSFLVSRVDM